MGQYFLDYLDKVNETADWFKKKTKIRPKLIIALTGGVDGPQAELSDVVEINASEVPNFPTTRVEGHEGKLIFGKFDGVDVVLLKGRYHYYEGHFPQEVIFPYFVMKELGAKSCIMTNASGGVRKDLNVGDIMLMTDHINAMGENPLRGIAMLRSENQFTGMTEAYDVEFQDVAQEEAAKLKINLAEGVYCADPGPSYETRSEVKMFRTMGADAMGMSTVFEVIACNFLGIKVLCFSCIANPAADRHEGKMSHKEVLEAMNASAPKLSGLVAACVKRIIHLQ